jgi:hypothetical protein
MKNETKPSPVCEECQSINTHSSFCSQYALGGVGALVGGTAWQFDIIDGTHFRIRLPGGIWSIALHIAQADAQWLNTFKFMGFTRGNGFKSGADLAAAMSENARQAHFEQYGGGEPEGC